MMPLYKNYIINTVYYLLYKCVTPDQPIIGPIIGPIISDFSSTNDKVTVVSQVCINLTIL